MFKNILLKVAVTLLLFFNTGYSFAQSWSYLGFARISTDTIFYIFVLNEKDAATGDQKITQKHVFSIPQKLSDGRVYSSILISRTLNCSDKTISTDKAVFSNGVGSTVGTYENKSATKLFQKISAGQDINLYLFEKYCPAN